MTNLTSPVTTTSAAGARNTAVVTVTVLDAATVFEGPETIYRYDLPGTGIQQGRCLGEAMDQIAALSAGQWPEVKVAVVADPTASPAAVEAVEILRRQLTVAGTTVVESGSDLRVDPRGEGESHANLEDAAPNSAAGEYRPRHALVEDPPEDGADALPTDQPVEPNPAVTRASGARWARWVDPFHVAIATVVVGVIGVSWWTVGGTAPATPPAPAAVEEGASASAAAPAESGGPAAHKEQTAVIEAEGMRVEVPTGFRTSVDDGLVTAIGGDPNLRILLAADPLYAVPAEALFAQLRAEIGEDPTLGDPGEESGKLSYVEKPGDDSQVAWTTWVRNDHQLSVGCHTRSEPSTAQKAACRMAVDSLELADPLARDTGAEEGKRENR